MHPRNRSPGNGFRSGGMSGVAPASRISPEGSVRGHAMYGSPYRNYNRGFGRGQPKPFQPPQLPPPRRVDVFMEAGKLATEYLVYKGLLPPNVLSAKWENGTLKNQVGDFQYFRAQEGDNLQEGRASALARLGDAVPDAVSGSGKRRFPDEYGPMGSRNYMKGSRRMGSFKNYGSEWNREIGRSGSWSEKSGASPDKEDNGDAFTGYSEEQLSGKDDGSEGQKLLPSELAPTSDAAGNSDSPFEKTQLLDDGDLKSSSSISGKDLPPEVDVESTERSDDIKILNVGTGEVKDDSSSGESEKPSVTEDIPIQHCEEEGDNANNGSDLLRFCRFAKVPTRTRSSLTIRGSKIDPVLIFEDENTNESGLFKESGGCPVEDVSKDIPLVDSPSNQSQSLNCLEPKISEVAPEDDAEKLGLAYKAGQGLCTRSRSFPERSFMNELESREGPLGFDRCSSMVIERGEKPRDSGEGTKKPREWTPSDAQADDSLRLSNSKENNSQEGRSSGEEVIFAVDQKRLIDISMFPRGGTEPCIEYAEEKQLFPGSFKICDLNLMEASDVNENHDADPILIFPSIPQNKKETAPVDVDLSMSSNCNITDKNGRLAADGKEVEVIDLESDTVQEDMAFNNTERKEETLFTGLESFPDHAQNVNEIPETQDGYGLMISELLGADISNCSPVPPDINSLHSEMDLHNGEGILGDDDAIYMSLGEIPISFLRVWEQQPAPEYEKPF